MYILDLLISWTTIVNLVPYLFGDSFRIYNTDSGLSLGLLVIVEFDPFGHVFESPYIVTDLLVYMFN